MGNSFKIMKVFLKASAYTRPKTVEHRYRCDKIQVSFVMYIFVRQISFLKKKLNYKSIRINTSILITDPQEPEKMTMDGVVRLLEDLQLDPGSKLVLLMAWKFQAAAQCEFSHGEFINGMTELG